MFRIAYLLLYEVRPRQWIKNAFLFAPIIFAEKMTDSWCLIRIIVAVVSFCLISSATYLYNDICDKERDRNHPVKKMRPIASGELGIVTAAIFGVILAAIGFLCAAWIDGSFFWTAATYGALQIGYSIILKKIVLLDLFSVAAGFVLRVSAGAFAINVPASVWLLLCTMLLALFLALAKRRHEYVLLGDEAVQHRATLVQYHPALLDQMIGIVTSAIVISYAMYTMAPESIARVGGPDLLYTVPFVLYGLFRYLFLIHNQQAGGEPEKTLLSDWPLIINGLAYGITVIIMLYLVKS